MRVLAQALCFVLLVLSLLMSPAVINTATAEETAEETAAAIARGHDGKEAFERGDYAAAEAAFREADDLVHSPVFVLFLARSQRAQGKLLEARASYERLVAEPLGDTSPPRWRAAVDEGREEAAALSERIPTVTVARGVAVDGVVSNGEAMPVNPGKHELRGTVGGRVIEKSIVVAAGERRTVTLETLEVPPRPAPHKPPARPTVPPEDAGGASPLIVAGALVLALGGGAHAASLVSGVLAMDRAASARETCGPTGQCAADTGGLYDDSLAASYASTALLVIGTAAAVAGTVLVLWPDEEASVGLGLGTMRLTLAF